MNSLVCETQQNSRMRSKLPGADLGGGVTRVTSHPPWRGSLFHVIIKRVT